MEKLNLLLFVAISMACVLVDAASTEYEPANSSDELVMITEATAEIFEENPEVTEYVNAIILELDQPPIEEKTKENEPKLVQKTLSRLSKIGGLTVAKVIVSTLLAAFILKYLVEFIADKAFDRKVAKLEGRISALEVATEEADVVETDGVEPEGVKPEVPVETEQRFLMELQAMNGKLFVKRFRANKAECRSYWWRTLGGLREVDPKTERGIDVRRENEIFKAEMKRRIRIIEEEERKRVEQLKKDYRWRRYVQAAKAFYG